MSDAMKKNKKKKFIQISKLVHHDPFSPNFQCQKIFAMLNFSKFSMLKIYLNMEGK